MPAGYSSNPPIKKLGIKDGYKCLIINESENYIDLLEILPPNTEFTDDILEGSFDFIHVLVTSEDKLAKS